MKSSTRPIFSPVISPIAFAAATKMRGFMRAAGAKSFKRWLFKTILDPYTNLSQERFIATSIFGARFEGTLSGLVQRRIFHFGVFEPNLTSWISERLCPGDVFVDVGANVGYFSLLASGLVGSSGRVVAVEASPSTFRALTHNLALNTIENVRCVNQAAYDQKATLPMYYIPDEENTGGASVVIQVGPREAEVVAAPLSEMLQQDELRRARVIKIDVEGAEDAAVAGLVPALGMLRDDIEIVVEVLPKTYDAVIARFAGSGMNCYLLENPVDPLNVTAAPAIAKRIRGDSGLAPSATDGAVAYVVFSRRDADAI